MGTPFLAFEMSTRMPLFRTAPYAVWPNRTVRLFLDNGLAEKLVTTTKKNGIDLSHLVEWLQVPLDHYQLIIPLQVAKPLWPFDLAQGTIAEAGLLR